MDIDSLDKKLLSELQEDVKLEVEENTEEQKKPKMTSLESMRVCLFCNK